MILVLKMLLSASRYSLMGVDRAALEPLHRAGLDSRSATSKLSLRHQRNQPVAEVPETMFQ